MSQQPPPQNVVTLPGGQTFTLPPGAILGPAPLQQQQPQPQHQGPSSQITPQSQQQQPPQYTLSQQQFAIPPGPLPEAKKQDPSPQPQHQIVIQQQGSQQQQQQQQATVVLIQNPDGTFTQQQVMQPPPQQPPPSFVVQQQPVKAGVPKAVTPPTVKVASPPVQGGVQPIVVTTGANSTSTTTSPPGSGPVRTRSNDSKAFEQHSTVAPYKPHSGQIAAAAKAAGQPVPPIAAGSRGKTSSYEVMEALAQARNTTISTGGHGTPLPPPPPAPPGYSPSGGMAPGTTGVATESPVSAPPRYASVDSVGSGTGFMQNLGIGGTGTFERLLIEKEKECQQLRQEAIKNVTVISALSAKVEQLERKVREHKDKLGYYQKLERQNNYYFAHVGGRGAVNPTNKPLKAGQALEFTEQISSGDGQQAKLEASSATPQQPSLLDQPDFGSYVSNQIQNKKGNLAAQAVTQAGSAVISLAVSTSPDSLSLIWDEISGKISAVLTPTAAEDYGVKSVVSCLNQMSAENRVKATSLIMAECRQDILLGLLCRESAISTLGPYLLTYETNPGSQDILFELMSHNLHVMCASDCGCRVIIDTLSGVRGEEPKKTIAERMGAVPVSSWTCPDLLSSEAIDLQERSSKSDSSAKNSGVVRPPMALTSPKSLSSESDNSGANVDGSSHFPVAMRVGRDELHPVSSYFIGRLLREKERMTLLQKAVQGLKSLDHSSDESSLNTSPISSSSRVSIENACIEICEILRCFPRKSYYSLAASEFVNANFRNETLMKQLCAHSPETSEFVQVCFIAPLLGGLSPDRFQDYVGGSSTGTITTVSGSFSVASASGREISTSLKQPARHVSASHQDPFASVGREVSGISSVGGEVDFVTTNRHTEEHADGAEAAMSIFNSVGNMVATRTTEYVTSDGAPPMPRTSTQIPSASLNQSSSTTTGTKFASPLEANDPEVTPGTTSSSAPTSQTFVRTQPSFVTQRYLEFCQWVIEYVVVPHCAIIGGSSAAGSALVRFAMAELPRADSFVTNTADNSRVNSTFPPAAGAIGGERSASYFLSSTDTNTGGSPPLTGGKGQTPEVRTHHQPTSALCLQLGSQLVEQVREHFMQLTKTPYGNEVVGQLYEVQRAAQVPMNEAQPQQVADSGLGSQLLALPHPSGGSEATTAIIPPNDSDAIFS